MGKKVVRIAISGVLVMTSGYMLYRIQGGPPIGKVIQAFRIIRAREKFEQSNKIVLDEGDYAVM